MPSAVGARDDTKLVHHRLLAGSGLHRAFALTYAEDAMPLNGHATPAGTGRYRQRQVDLNDQHFRTLQDGVVSSIGFGTYLGDPDDATDQRAAEALETALALGCNFLDTASNYRCQRSERVIGQTLTRLVAQGVIAREEAVVCTKGGYLPFDGEFPADPSRYLIETFLNPGIVRYDELVAGCHCIAPSYLAHQLNASLQNLRLETIDVYYLHNPEQQLDEMSRETFLTRMEAAFGFLEAQVKEHRIRWFGASTWNGYRANPAEKNFLSLEELAGIARRVGGEAHHFRVMQCPLNLAMPEAYGFKNQTVNGKLMSLLEAASALGLSVVISASLLQRRLTKLPAAMSQLIPGAQTDAQRALQFVRSVPGVTTALVGMTQRVHVEENLALARIPPLAPEQLARLFTRTKS